MAENLSLDEVKLLARTMTIKTMLAGIPIGGAKGGVSITTDHYDKKELLKFACETLGPYIRQQKLFLGTDLGFAEPDVNQLYECARTKRRLFMGSVTVGEACAVGIATSLGFVENNGIHRYKQRTVAIEGFGRIGAPTARLLSFQGFRIVAISNLAGTLFDAKGLDTDELSSASHTTPEMLLSNYAKNHTDAIILPRDSLLNVDSEILIPGARALVLGQAQALQTKAKVVCPVSNAPVTSEGEQTLADRGIVSVPDVISNSGGLIASFAQHLGASAEQTRTIIGDVITHNLVSVFGKLSSAEIPKKNAVNIASERLRRIRESEGLGLVEFLYPWIRSLGLNALLYGFKEYLDLKIGG